MSWTTPLVPAAAALAAGPLLANVVYLVAPRDPVVVVIVALLLTAVGFGFCWAPLRRLLRTDPMPAVRTEMNS